MRMLQQKKVLWVVAFSLFFMAFFQSFSQAQQLVMLKSGTPVALEVVDTITSDKVAIGDIVKLRVIRSVKVDDVEVIKAGAEARGKVSDVKKTGTWGKKGELSIAVSSVRAVDDQEVFLLGSQTREGESKGGSAVGASVVGGILCLPFAASGFFIKGDEGRILAGYEVKAYTEQDIRINVGL